VEVSTSHKIASLARDKFIHGTYIATTILRYDGATNTTSLEAGILKIKNDLKKSFTETNESKYQNIINHLSHH
jgi:hypothetical protein